MKILLAEDDQHLGKLLSMLLKNQHIQVHWVTDGKAAYEACYQDGYDVLVLDWMMPELDGVRLCRCLREESYGGKILMLTAKDAVEDRVEGLNSGADDYLVKPFGVEELVARLHALHRRQGIYQGEDVRYGGFWLEQGRYLLHYEEKAVELRPREFKLLELLLRNRNTILPRDVLLERVWGWDSEVSENNLEAHIRLLRKKIKEISDVELIHTVRGVGYMAGEGSHV